MARLSGIVIPGIPHHVTQRDNGRQQTFLGDDGYAFFRNTLRQYCTGHGLKSETDCLCLELLQQVQ
jgi:putative transposase